MTNEEYRKHEGVSKSDLFELVKSPLHFKHRMENPGKDTPALIFGSAAHKYILEPESFDKEFVVSPQVDRRTKAGKELYAEFEKEAEGKKVITIDDMEKIKAMSEQIDKTPLARQLLTGEIETSLFWTDASTGEKCKCRPDVLTEFEGEKVIVDYKTTDSCQDGHFERSVKKYGYKLQAGMYREGVFQNTLASFGFYFVAQEKTEPYAVRIYKCNPEFINQGYDQFRELIGIYHDCNKTGQWQGYGYNGLNVVELVGEEGKK